MKFRKIISMLLMAVLLAAGLSPVKTAYAASANISLADGAVKNIDAAPGKQVHVKVPITARQATGVSIVASVADSCSEQAVIDNIVMKSTDGFYVTDTLIGGESAILEFDLTMKNTTKIGSYTISIELVYSMFNPSDGSMSENTDVISLTANVITELAPIQLVVDKVSYISNSAAIGNQFDITFTIKNEGEIDAYNTYAGIAFGSSGIVPEYSVESKKVGDLASGASAQITFPVSVLASAEAGLKTLDVVLTCKDKEGNEKIFTRTVYVTIQNSGSGESTNANIQVSADSFNAKYTAGQEAVLKVTLKNIGSASAYDVLASLSAGVGIASGIIPKYSEGDIASQEIKKGKEAVISFPVLISQDASSGLREITVTVTYTDENGKIRTAETSIYLTIENASEAIVNDVVINNVKQSADKPKAGENLTITFNIENKGNKAISNVRVSGENLSSAGFEPINSEPYISVGTIEAGTSKTVSVTFKVGKNISAGLNTLSIGYSYTDASEASRSESAQLYILNVVNDGESSDTGRPKIIVSDFSTDADELKAGSTFNFVFSLKNTHATKAAKNIKVTILQNENVFTVTEGSNSFYINSIGAGEEVESTINLKVKADAMTSTYDIIVKVEYEYDDMAKTDSDNGGVSEENILKLPVVENARPVVDNINMYDMTTYESPMANSTSSMTFEFYNMGKSSLSNVYITVEGDFELSGKTMQYVGSVTAGSGEYIETEVIPLIDGMATCTIVVHFEDSNGNEVTTSTDYTTYVSAQQTTDPDDWNNPSDGGDVPVIVDVKDPVMKTWVFVLILVGIVIVVLPVTRAIVIAAYKAKLRRQEELGEMGGKEQ